ncbi:hypothetical protein EDB92DRAFT_451946 [Lactarius akahatsu]|uniref:Uncharacterized protein n=1 Tax=Lactarius akahatsu TaxID=416441 RepID=A0AAD4Q840_9AGAM|nr:hypothetical protein EDB92DRAFT_451946 [Lactarius akahatsu]
MLSGCVFFTGLTSKGAAYSPNLLSASLEAPPTALPRTALGPVDESSTTRPIWLFSSSGLWHFFARAATCCSNPWKHGRSRLLRHLQYMGRQYMTRDGLRWSLLPRSVEERLGVRDIGSMTSAIVYQAHPERVAIALSVDGVLSIRIVRKLADDGDRGQRQFVAPLVHHCRWTGRPARSYVLQCQSRFIRCTRCWSSL